MAVHRHSSGSVVVSGSRGSAVKPPVTPPSKKRPASNAGVNGGLGEQLSAKKQSRGWKVPPGAGGGDEVPASSSKPLRKMATAASEGSSAIHSKRKPAEELLKRKCQEDPAKAAQQQDLVRTLKQLADHPWQRQSNSQPMLPEVLVKRIVAALQDEAGGARRDLAATRMALHQSFGKILGLPKRLLAFMDGQAQRCLEKGLREVDAKGLSLARDTINTLWPYLTEDEQSKLMTDPTERLRLFLRCYEENGAQVLLGGCLQPLLDIMFGCCLKGTVEAYLTLKGDIMSNNLSSPWVTNHQLNGIEKMIDKVLADRGYGHSGTVKKWMLAEAPELPNAVAVSYLEEIKRIANEEGRKEGLKAGHEAGRREGVEIGRKEGASRISEAWLWLHEGPQSALQSLAQKVQDLARRIQELSMEDLINSRSCMAKHVFWLFQLLEVMLAKQDVLKDESNQHVLKDIAVQIMTCRLLVADKPMELTRTITPLSYFLLCPPLRRIAAENLLDVISSLVCQGVASPHTWECAKEVAKLLKEQCQKDGDSDLLAPLDKALAMAGVVCNAQDIAMRGAEQRQLRKRARGDDEACSESVSTENDRASDLEEFLDGTPESNGWGIVADVNPGKEGLPATSGDTRSECSPQASAKIKKWCYHKWRPDWQENYSRVEAQLDKVLLSGVANFEAQNDKSTTVGKSPRARKPNKEEGKPAPRKTLSSLVRQSRASRASSPAVSTAGTE
mmetsp:Transcript_52382/g.125120  ORF Transcript_52382/g.125120 Transcript_52382/m.125120 type:complete len:729 (-) Transcript_52382:71-2257(-)